MKKVVGQGKSCYTLGVGFEKLCINFIVDSYTYTCMATYNKVNIVGTFSQNHGKIATFMQIPHRLALDRVNLALDRVKY